MPRCRAVEAWSSDRLPVVCVVPEGKALTQCRRSRASASSPGRASRWQPVGCRNPVSRSGSIRSAALACDVNFVRGEDSFVRAQFAARPLVWQAYPQDEGAHLNKSAASWRVMRAHSIPLRAPFIARLPTPGTANPLTLRVLGELRLPARCTCSSRPDLGWNLRRREACNQTGGIL